VTNRLWSSRTFIFLAGLVALTSVRMTLAAPELEFDHVWIVVTRDAPERAALELHRKLLPLACAISRLDARKRMRDEGPSRTGILL
jgi:hypothetical protein